jgi:hypothetical protein
MTNQCKAVGRSVDGRSKVTYDDIHAKSNRVTEQADERLDIESNLQRNGKGVKKGRNPTILIAFNTV